MSPGTASTTWHHLRVVARAWTMSFGTKQNWLKNCMMFMSKMKKAMILKHGLFIVKVEDCQKCDIFATPSNPYYSGDLTPKIKKFFLSRKRGGNGKFLTKCMNLLNNQSTTTIFYAVDGGRVGQFLAVFVHLSCEAIFCFYFLRGRPKTPLIV